MTHVFRPTDLNGPTPDTSRITPILVRMRRDDPSGYAIAKCGIRFLAERIRSWCGLVTNGYAWHARLSYFGIILEFTYGRLNNRESLSVLYIGLPNPSPFEPLAYRDLGFVTLEADGTISTIREFSVPSASGVRLNLFGKSDIELLYKIELLSASFKGSYHWVMISFEFGFMKLSVENRNIIEHYRSCHASLSHLINDKILSLCLSNDLYNPSTLTKSGAVMGHVAKTRADVMPKPVTGYVFASWLNQKSNRVLVRRSLLETLLFTQITSALEAFVWDETPFKRTFRSASAAMLNLILLAYSIPGVHKAPHALARNSCVHSANLGRSSVRTFAWAMHSRMDAGLIWRMDEELLDLLRLSPHAGLCSVWPRWQGVLVSQTNIQKPKAKAFERFAERHCDTEYSVIETSQNKETMNTAFTMRRGKNCALSTTTTNALASTRKMPLTTDKDFTLASLSCLFDSSDGIVLPSLSSKETNMFVGNKAPCAIDAWRLSELKQVGTWPQTEIAKLQSSLRRVIETATIC